MSMTYKTKIILDDPHKLRAIAVRALVDPRTVAAYLRKRRVKPSLAARIRAALHDLATAEGRP